MKKKILNVSKILFLLLFILNFITCGKHEGVELQKDKDLNSLNEIQITEIAQKIHFSNLKSTNSQKQVKSVKAVLTQKNENAFYIINYKDGGFVILSADIKVSPVLAFSENNTFPLEAVVYPEGISDWINFQIKNVEEVKVKNLTQTKKINKEWENIDKLFNLNRQKSEPADDPCACTDQLIQRDPLLVTNWDQYNGFNDSCNFGNSPAGCVAIAMAQVMRLSISSKL
jgi:hypothetical protein